MVPKSIPWNVILVSIGLVILSACAPKVATLSQQPVEHSLVQASNEKEVPPVKTAGYQGVRIDQNHIAESEWTNMISLCQDSAGIRAGGGMTLLRVILENAATNAIVQLSSVKLALPREAKLGGGGAFQEIRNGDFILLEHINSSRRRDGKDLLEIGTFTHRHAKLWVQVPKPGTLGILGDVILQRCPEQEMGRLEATIKVESKTPLRIRNLRLGPVAVGGPYGETLSFDGDQKCHTRPIPPGNYKVLLPDFDMHTSRWTVTVSPGKVTRLEFIARSQTQIDKMAEVVLPDPRRID